MNNLEEQNKKIVLADGSEYYGVGFGSDSDRLVEIVFNTSMVGYQEILSDPSYTYQAVVMTYPLIGNYGMCDDDYESLNPSVSGMIVREYCDTPSNFRNKESLSSVMKRYDIVGIQGIDTRTLARRIRDIGSCKAYLVSAKTSKEEALRVLNEWVPETDAVSKVSTKEVYVSEPEKADYHVVAIDCGMKANIVRRMVNKGCKVTVVPYNTTAEQIKAYNPDGVFLSNGPGDPTDVKETIQTVKDLIGQLPIFGICLGHQILSLAYGAKTYKLKFGHRGGNHPVMNLITDKIEITSQNHSYAVEDASLAKTKLTATHINILDKTIEGVSCEADKAFSVQYHPESAPGPQDSDYLFDIFLKNMKAAKEGK